MNHILSVPNVARPWWPTHQRFPDAPVSILTDCCCCRMKRSETISRVVSHYDYPLGGLGCYQVPPSYADQERDGPWAKADFPTGAYYGFTIETECAPGKGCNANPRRKFGKHLREMMRWGP
jgi:hypothetical protein